ncbi:LytR/AlgR family response regulator transcription factor [Parachryseolinea silvisoli]|jgi:DNA-binding LytR/AlgR family response regulator|uniref:LytR/AlgR family response regulator transcription factor n=1 Tax=Parachryseolinea silvisoli TaxID=2873601 RepID=UPI00295EBAE7|nr:LytTR family DNA-binding domain-containing protein [Parachryseolinea silvisoli]MCD9016673.1 LytTR family DNA-binding domain-containing protein [Parachryseolinea silvisoli]
MIALIIEDEIEAAERLVTLLEECEPSIRIVQTIDSVQDAVQYFSAGKRADLVFMDIQLADGKSFEIFDKVKIDSPIIFTTAFDQYALQAFKLHSVDYLLKPIQANELMTAIQKLKKVYQSDAHLTHSDIAALKEIIANAGSRFKQRLLIKSGNKLQYKPVDSVCYFFADGKTSYLVGKGDAKRFIVDHTLEELEDMLNPRQFFRISRKYIVNFDCVWEVKGLMSSKLEVKLNQTCEHDLSVSRERAHEFKKWMDR